MAFALPPLAPASAPSDGLVPYVTSRGVAFMQLYQRLGPVGEYLYVPFEKSYDTNPGTAFTREHWWLPVSLYMAAIFFGKKHMATRERLDLR